jgi:hypothetical protein
VLLFYILSPFRPKHFTNTFSRITRTWEYFLCILFPLRSSNYLFHSQGHPYGVCGGHCGTKACFFPSISFSLPLFIPPTLQADTMGLFEAAAPGHSVSSSSPYNCFGEYPHIVFVLLSRSLPNIMKGNLHIPGKYQVHNSTRDRGRQDFFLF